MTCGWKARTGLGAIPPGLSARRAGLASAGWCLCGLAVSLSNGLGGVIALAVVVQRLKRAYSEFVQVTGLFYGASRVPFLVQGA